MPLNIFHYVVKSQISWIQITLARQNIEIRRRIDMMLNGTRSVNQSGVVGL